MEWSNEKIIHFLELYEAQPVIWDTTLEGHRNRNSVHDAWKEIAKEMGETCTVADLKKKKDSLMASFRLYKKKIKDSKRSGGGANEVYKPTWFAYLIIDRFLGKKNMPVPTFNTADLDVEHEGSEVDDSLADEDTTTTHEDSPRVTEHNAGVVLPTKSTSSSFLQRASKRQRLVDTDYITRKMDTAFSIIQASAQKPACKEKDECAIYADLIASKLRKLTEEDRDVCMNQMDNLIYSFTSKRWKSAVPSSTLLHTISRFSPYFRNPSPHSFSSSPTFTDISSPSPPNTTSMVGHRSTPPQHPIADNLSDVAKEVLAPGGLSSTQDQFLNQERHQSADHLTL